MTNWEFSQRFHLSGDAGAIRAYRNSFELCLNRFISYLISRKYTDDEILRELSLSYPELTRAELSEYIRINQKGRHQD